MKAFTKLALVSAIALTSTAFAMEAADDATLSAATGQDGITILIAPGPQTDASLLGLGVTQETIDLIDLRDATGALVAGGDGHMKGLNITKIVVHDKDGMTGNLNSGTMAIGGVVLFADNNLPISVDIDMVGSVSDAGRAATGGAATGAMLNVAISTPKLAVMLGAISVGNSNGNALNFTEAGAGSADIENTVVAGVDGLYGTADDGLLASSSELQIMSGMEIILGAMTTNIQLGSEAQGAMIVVNAAIQGGLSINNMSLDDSGGSVRGGGIRADRMTVINAGGTFGVANLNAVAAVNVGGPLSASSPLGEGLYLTLQQLGAGGGADITLYNQKLGSAAAPVIGDVQLLGLNLDGTDRKSVV